MFKNFLKILKLLCIAMVFCFLQCCDTKKDSIETKNEEKVDKISNNLVVIAERINPEKHNKKLHFMSEIKNNDLLSVNAEVGGIISKFHFLKGSYVKKYDLIIEIENEKQTHQYEWSQLNLEEKSLQYDTTAELFNNNLASQVDLQLAELEVKNAKNLVENAQIDLDKTLIYAPFEGYIDDINVYEKDLVSAGQKLFNIFNQQKLSAIFYATAENLKDLKMGSKIIDSYSKKALGEIKFISNIADHKNKTYKIECNFYPNNLNYLKIGMPLKILVDCGEYNIFKIKSSVIIVNDEGKIGVRTIDDEQKVKFLSFSEILLQDDQYFYVTFNEDLCVEYLNVIVLGQEFVKNDSTVEVKFNDNEL